MIRQIKAPHVGDCISYATKGKGKEETIVVIIHNFSPFTEVYDELEGNAAYLTREGTKYGIFEFIRRYCEELPENYFVGQDDSIICDRASVAIYNINMSSEQLGLRNGFKLMLI